THVKPRAVPPNGLPRGYESRPILTGAVRGALRRTTRSADRSRETPCRDSYPRGRPFGGTARGFTWVRSSGQARLRQLSWAERASANTWSTCSMTHGSRDTAVRASSAARPASGRARSSRGRSRGRRGSGCCTRPARSGTRRAPTARSGHSSNRSTRTSGGSCPCTSARCAASSAGGRAPRSTVSPSVAHSSGCSRSRPRMRPSSSSWMTSTGSMRRRARPSRSPRRGSATSRWCCSSRNVTVSPTRSAGACRSCSCRGCRDWTRPSSWGPPSTRASHGNPLAMLETADELTDEQCRGDVALPRTLHLGDVLLRGFLRRTEGASVAERRILLLTAADEHLTLGQLREAATAAGYPPSAVADVLQRDVLTVGRGNLVHFTHPLLGHAVYQH